MELIALRPSKKIEAEIPFGVGAVYKTIGLVETDIVELWISELRRQLYKRRSNVICLIISPQVLRKYSTSVQLVD
jgi:hypothetical protein